VSAFRTCRRQPDPCYIALRRVFPCFAEDSACARLGLQIFQGGGLRPVFAGIGIRQFNDRSPLDSCDPVRSAGRSPPERRRLKSAAFTSVKTGCFSPNAHRYGGHNGQRERPVGHRSCATRIDVLRHNCLTTNQGSPHPRLDLFRLITTLGNTPLFSMSPNRQDNHSLRPESARRERTSLYQRSRYPSAKPSDCRVAVSPHTGRGVNDHAELLRMSLMDSPD